MTNIKKDHEFLPVKLGDIVLIGDSEIAKVLTFIGASRDPDALTPFQPLNVDKGELNWVHFEEVNGIVPSRKSSWAYVEKISSN